MAHRCYRILGLGVRVEAEPAAFLETFQANYARFEVAALDPAGPSLDFRFEDGPAGPSLAVDGVPEPLAGHPHPREFAAMRLAQLVMDRVRGFTVLHAGVVGTSKGTLAVAGPSGAGKTTLTLALVEAGLSYFSDDFCPLSRATGQVHPFPRSLWVQAAAGRPASRRGKAILPLDGPGMRVADGPMPLAWVICLQDAPVPGDPVEQLGVALREGREGPFLEAIRAVPGASVQAPGGEWPELWRIRYPRSAFRAVKAELDRHHGACWNVFSLAAARPDFTREPSLTPIPPMEAAFFLLRELRHSLLDPGLPGAMKPGALLAHLGALLAGTACYRLTPGPLARQLKLVQEVLAGGTPG